MVDVSVHQKRFESLAAFIEAHGSKKVFIAEKLEISRFQLEGLLLSEGHQPPAAIYDVRSDLADRVAAMIGQTADYVRDYYLKAAA